MVTGLGVFVVASSQSPCHLVCKREKQIFQYVVHINTDI